MHVQVFLLDWTSLRNFDPALARAAWGMGPLPSAIKRVQQTQPGGGAVKLATCNSAPDLAKAAASRSEGGGISSNSSSVSVRNGMVQRLARSLLREGIPGPAVTQAYGPWQAVERWPCRLPREADMHGHGHGHAHAGIDWQVRTSG